MDARQLRYFLAVIDHGGITKAAKALYVAQPTMSQSIQALERELGAALFHRVGRRMVISVAGEALLGPARQIQQELDAIHNTARQISRLELGWLNIVSPPELAVDPLVQLIARFRSRYPKVWVNVLGLDRNSTVDELLRRAVGEVGLTVLPVTADGSDVVPLGVRRLMLVAPSGSALVGSDPIPLEELRHIPLIFGERGTMTRDLVDETLARFSSNARVAVEVRQEGKVLDLVLAGAGAALLPEKAAAQAGRRGAVVRSTVPAMEQRIGLIHRRAPVSPSAEAFLEIAREVARP